MPDIDLIDRSLDRENTQKYHLSIQADLNGLSFCILDKKENTILYFQRVDFEKQLDPIKVLSKIELTYEKEEELLPGERKSESRGYRESRSEGRKDLPCTPLYWQEQGGLQVLTVKTIS